MAEKDPTTPDSALSRSASATTLAFEVYPSTLLITVVAGCHAICAFLVIARWQFAYEIAFWVLLAALIGFGYSCYQWLIPGYGRATRRVEITRAGEWWLDDDAGYLLRAWVTPSLCRVTVARSSGGRRCIWLARDAIGDAAHWSLRRLLIQAESPR